MQKTIIAISIVFMLIFAGCSNKGDDQEEATNVYPLTGKNTTEEIMNRPVAVMVSNQAQARPQTGLSKADIVFEMLTEGNVTRFMAIYQSKKPEVVGPVRSAREYFFDLADDYDALYVYHGAANFVNDLIKEKEIDYIDGAKYDDDGHLFVRETFRKTPHNSYLQFDAVSEVAKEKGYEMEKEIAPLDFLEKDDEIDGENANYVKIDYYGGTPIVEYKYDEETKKYMRYGDDEQTIELESEKPIAVDNLFVVEADHEVIDDEQRRDIDTHSGGKGYLFQRGKVQEVDWENQEGRIVPVKDGEVVSFVQGQTWINFVQTEPEKDVEEQVQIENKE